MQAHIPQPSPAPLQPFLGLPRLSVLCSCLPRKASVPLDYGLNCLPGPCAVLSVMR